MEPENEPLEEEIPIRNYHFQIFSDSMLVFGGINKLPTSTGEFTGFQEPNPTSEVHRSESRKGTS